MSYSSPHEILHSTHLLHDVRRLHPYKTLSSLHCYMQATEECLTGDDLARIDLEGEGPDVESNKLKKHSGTQWLFGLFLRDLRMHLSNMNETV